MNNPFDMTTYTEGQVDAFVKSNKAATKGMEQLSRHFFEFATKSFEETIEAGKKLASTKTPVEFAQLQMKLAQESLQNIVGETKKISELAATIVKDASEPLTETFRANLAGASKKKS